MTTTHQSTTDTTSMLHVRPGRLVLGAFIGALGFGVILLEAIEEDAWSAAPFAVLVAAVAGIAGVVAGHRSWT